MFSGPVLSVFKSLHQYLRGFRSRFGEEVLLACRKTFLPPRAKRGIVELVSSLGK